MPTLEWIGKSKVINHHQDVPFRVLERKYSFNENGQADVDNGSENMIIRGDNLEALKALLPRYEGRVKCIYIDPPYNTGEENWIYNDNVNDPHIREWLHKAVGKEGEDLTRHDKWLCMMYPRLKLLQKLLAEDGAIFIGKNAFQACKALESITIPKNVSEIGGGAFSNCSSLATAEILGPVKELTGTTGVFLGCAALKNVTLPDTLTNIGTGTFNGCASLEKIDLPAGLTEIGREAFNGCESLKEAIIPDGVTEIPSYAFTGCLALEKVELPEGITSIGEYAFDLTAENDSGEYVNENPKLESINIPSTVTSIAGNFLGGVKANGETALIFEGENPPTFGLGALDGISGASFNKPTVYYPAEAVDAYTSEDSDLVTNGLVSAPVEGEENSNQYSLAVSPSATSVYENNTINFTVESTLPQDATLMVESSNTKVATAALSSDQKSVTVTGVKEGTATITVSIKLSDVVLASENVTVTVDERGSSGTTRYMVSVEDADNGTIKVSPTRASKGSTVTINVTPDEGYELDKLVVTDKNGDTVKLTDKGSGTYTFKMPASKVTVEATFTQIATEPETLPFTDVKTGDWFYEAVQYVYDKGMMTGVSADRFAPASTTTRGMIVTILYRLENEPAVSGGSAFTDVESGAWYADAVAWAAANDIVNGTSATTFAPNSPITREQMATMLYRFAQYKGMDAVTLQENLTGYPDGDQVSDYAIPAMNWAVGQGLIAGMENGTLVPQGSATRAQVATILMRFCESIG